MFARKVHDLRDLGFRDLVRIDAAFADPVIVNMQHNSCGGFVVLSEEALQNMHDEFHRRVVVVDQHHLVQGWFLEARCRLLDHQAVARSCLVAVLFAAHEPCRQSVIEAAAPSTPL